MAGVASVPQTTLGLAMLALHEVAVAGASPWSAGLLLPSVECRRPGS
jgi:hypothetical protein